MANSIGKKKYKKSMVLQMEMRAKKKFPLEIFR